MLKYRQLLLIIVLLIISASTYSQSHKFRVYDLEQGLPEPFIYDIIQDEHGYLWVATGSGLAKFDGYNFEIFNDQESFTTSFINVCFIDSRKRLWVGLQNGDIFYYENYQFNKLTSDKSIKSIINDIKEDEEGNLWCTSQNNGIIKIDKDLKTTVFPITDKLCYSIQPLEKNKILLGTNEGIYIYNTSEKSYKDVDQNPYTLISVITKDNKNQYWLGTEDEGVYYCEYVNSTITPIKFQENAGLENFKIQDIFFDQNENIWLATFGAGVIYSKKNKNFYDDFQYFNVENGLKSNTIKTIYQDKESNIWIGMYGEGLSTLSDDFFTFYSNEGSEQKNNITAFYSDKKNIWLGAEDQLIQIDFTNINKWNFRDLITDDIITSLYQDVQENLWIGTEKSGLIRYDTDSKKTENIFISNDQLVNSINFIDGYGDNIWIASKNGIIKYNTISKESVIYNTSNGLPHNNINHLYIDINENVWVSTQSNDLYIIKQDKIVNYKISNNSEILTINGITRDKAGNIWIATYGNGVYVYDSLTFVNYNINNGLKSNYCYSIICDVNNNIWIGHRQGLSRIFSDKLIKTYGKNDGIAGDCNKNIAFMDANSNIWFGTTNGVIKYDYRKDKKNEIPPVINITSVRFSDNKIDHNKPMVMPYAVYKLTIEFIGISHTDPKGVKYKYKLKEYDLDWSETFDNKINYNRIEDGDYELQIKACNSDGVWTK
ncbi:MAG: two-component regulator propeller domain-containing protein, partial [Bacteroidota bacterium]